MTGGDPVARFEDGLARVAAAFPGAFEAAGDEHALRAVNARFVGPQGDLTQLMKSMRDVPPDRRRDLGQRANALKLSIEAAFDAALSALVSSARRAELEGPPIDVTLPGRGLVPGKLHPITRVAHDLLDIFGSLGFDVVEGPEIDLHEYNFDRLGFPPDHPATDMQDSFFVHSDRPELKPLLRTHTSTAQIRTMLERKPPLAVISPGVVYRRDDDATHSPMFHQLEGLLVDEGVDFADLKGVLTLFVQRLFGSNVRVRFRPSYFPFVEPGGEMDIWRGDRWMEVLGCGMVHPVVFENVGYDPEQYTGFAFGMGIDRIAMLRYGVDNIKTLFENDVRFLTSL